jgi:hypothetical protein
MVVRNSGIMASLKFLAGVKRKLSGVREVPMGTFTIFWVVDKGR